MVGYRVPLRAIDDKDWSGRYGYDSWFERTTERSYIAGLDLGQANDPSALAIVEVLKQPDAKPGQRFHALEDMKFTSRLGLRHLERLPLRMPYPAQADYVTQLLHTAPLAGNTELVIDATAIGRPVSDIFKRVGRRPVNITITSGDGWSNVEGGFHVSKLILISQLVHAVQTGAIKFAAGIKDLPALVAELKNFQIHYSAEGRASFGARVGRHDDLVLALAIACWYALHKYANRVITKPLKGLVP